MTKTSDTKGLTKKQKKILLQATVDYVWTKLYREYLLWGHHQELFNPGGNKRIPYKKP